MDGAQGCGCCLSLMVNRGYDSSAETAKALTALGHTPQKKADPQVSPKIHLITPTRLWRVALTKYRRLLGLHRVPYL